MSSIQIAASASKSKSDRVLAALSILLLFASTTFSHTVNSKLGLAIWDESQAVETLLRSTATREFRSSGDYEKYFAHLESRNYIVRENRGYWIAVNREALYVYASLLQAQLIQKIVTSDAGFVEVSQLSLDQRRLLAGRFSQHPAMVESLEKGEGVIKAVPEARVTVEFQGDLVSESRVLGIPTAPVEGTSDPSARRVAIDAMQVPTSWDVRLAEVFPSRSPTVSYRAYAELMLLITEEIDEEVRQVIADTAETLKEKIGEGASANLTDLRANQPLPDRWRSNLVEMTESWRGVLSDQELERRRSALEHGTVSNVDIVFFLSLDLEDRRGTRVRALGISFPLQLRN